MIKLNNKKIKFLNSGDKIVERVYFGEDLIYTYPPYLLISSDVESNNPVKLSLFGGGKSKNVTKQVTKNNSPVRFEVDYDIYGKQLTAINYQSGDISSVVIKFLDASFFSSMSNIFARIYNNPNEDVLKTKIYDSIVIPEGVSLQQSFYGHHELTEAIFNPILTGINYNTYCLVSNCPKLKTADLSGLKLLIGDNDNRIYELVNNCESLEFLDISGISVDLDYFTSLESFSSLYNKIKNLVVKCPSLKQIRLKFELFSAMVHVLSYTSVLNIFGFDNGYVLGPQTYEQLKAQTFFDIIDLDDYKEFL